MFSAFFLTCCICICASHEFHSPLFGVGRGSIPIFKRSTHLAVRQTGNTDTLRKCSQVLYETQCTNTQYVRNLINLISDCAISVGSFTISYATSFEAACRKNSNGDYCGTVGIDAATFINAQSLCSSSCTSACRSTVTSLISQHGCCLTSNSAISGLVSGPLSTCGMSLPASCPKSSIVIPTNTSTDSSCSTSEEALRRIYSYACIKQNVEPILKALRSTNGCNNFVELSEIGCSYRNGKYCYESFINPQSSAILLLTSAAFSCTSTSSCPSSCKISLSAVRNDLGCCFSLINSSLQIVQSIAGGSNTDYYTTISSNELWDECGIATPNLCSVRFTNAAISPYITHIFLLVVLITVIITLY